MNKERMLKLADLLDNCAPRKNFDMASFVESDKNGAKEKITLKEMIQEKNCGTTCCIAGWAVLMKNKSIPLSGGVEAMDVPETAQEYLELTNDQADDLFFTGWGQTPKMAAKKIRRWIAEEKVSQAKG